jgi:hypothetical protein
LYEWQWSTIDCFMRWTWFAVVRGVCVCCWLARSCSPLSLLYFRGFCVCFSVACSFALFVALC